MNKFGDIIFMVRIYKILTVCFHKIIEISSLYIDMSM